MQTNIIIRTIHTTKNFINSSINFNIITKRAPNAFTNLNYINNLIQIKKAIIESKYSNFNINESVEKQYESYKISVSNDQITLNTNL